MLNFLNVKYVSDETLNELKIDATRFKRPKAAHDFDPYTTPQRQRILFAIKGIVKWLIRNGKKDEGQKLEQFYPHSNCN